MKFSFDIKKIGIGTWISLFTCVIVLVAAILYGVSSATTFVSATIPPVAVCVSLAIIFVAITIVSACFELDGVVGKVVSFLIGALRIVIPVLLVLCLLYSVNARVTNLAFLYFSDESTSTNFTAEEFAAGSMIIADLVLFGISIVTAIVASFFGIRKKEKPKDKKEQPEETAA